MPGSCPAGLRRVPAVQSWLPQRRGKGGSEIRELGRRQQAPPDVGCFGERRAAAGAFLRKVARVAQGGARCKCHCHDRCPQSCRARVSLWKCRFMLLVNFKTLPFVSRRKTGWIKSLGCAGVLLRWLFWKFKCKLHAFPRLKCIQSSTSRLYHVPSLFLRRTSCPRTLCSTVGTPSTMHRSFCSGF